MDRLKLLIADGAEEFRAALEEALGREFSVHSCASGPETLTALENFRPDLLVLDLMMPGLDGISLLHAAAEKQLRPVVLVTTRLAHDYIVDSLQQLGVSYIMMKPCSIRATADRVRDLARRIRNHHLPNTDPRAAVCGMLLALGVPTKLHGYQYLLEAICLEALRPGQSVTKELYPGVAILCGSQPSHVERSIRSAIQAAWEHRDDQVWALYFPVNEFGRISRPTNAAFISRLCAALRHNRTRTLSRENTG